MLRPAPMAIAARQLPAPTTTFVGRHDDLVTIARWFDAGHRLVALVGPPGIGKTRAAIEYASSIRDRTVRFCDLSEVHDLDGLCAHVAVALGIGLEAGTDVAAAVALALREARDLIVLDNAEHVVDAGATTIARWLERAPAAQFLITSRERLRIAGEVVHELGPLSLPSGGDGSSSEAVALFVDRARQLRREFALDDTAGPIVAEIVRRLDGIPLAIEVAAARMDVLGPATLAERLHQGDAGGRRDANARQATLRGAIDDSWHALTPAAQTVLAQVAVFRGGFTLDAAEHIIDVSAIAGAPPIVDVLADLRAKSLLRAVGTEPRFRLYESIRDYALDRLIASGQLTPTRIRHATYYVCRYAGDERKPPREIAVERDNLIAVVDNALAYPATAEPTRVAMEVLLALDPVLPRSGPSETHLGWFEAALARPRDLVEPRLRTDVLLARGRALLARGRCDASLVGFDDAVTSARELHDPRLEARALVGIGIAHHRRHRDGDARLVFERALELLDPHDHRRIGVVRGYLGDLEQQAGRLVTARAQFRDALELVQSIGHDRAYLESTLRLRLGFLALDEGNPDETQHECEQVMALATRVRSRRLHGLGDSLMALACWSRGRLDDADLLIARAERTFVQAGDVTNLGFALAIRGAIDATRDRIDDAGVAFAAAEAAHADNGDQIGLAALAIYRGHLDLARARAQTDAAVAAKYRAEAERRTTQDTVGSHASQARVALRSLQRALADAGATTREDDVLVVDRSERQIHVPGRVRWVRFGRQTVLWRLLVELCEARLRTPGQAVAHDQLIAAGWPGQTVAASSAQNRLHVALNSLRKLGLRAVMLTRDDGYLISPSVRVRWVS